MDRNAILRMISRHTERTIRLLEQEHVPDYVLVQELACGVRLAAHYDRRLTLDRLNAALAQHGLAVVEDPTAKERWKAEMEAAEESLQYEMANCPVREKHLQLLPGQMCDRCYYVPNDGIEDSSPAASA